MAKVVITERDKIIHLVRREIVCSRCDAPSGMTGPAVIAKYFNKDWQCKKCQPIRANSPKPLCVCGHLKTRHHGSKHSCKVSTRNDGVRGWKLPRWTHRDRTQCGKYSWKDCECKRYSPAEKD